MARTTRSSANKETKNEGPPRSRTGETPIFMPLLFALLSFYFLKDMALPARSEIPEHLLGHPVEYTRNLIAESTGIALKNLVHEMSVFPSNIAADLKTGGFRVRHPHIGEAVPTVAVIDEESNKTTYKCDHDFMVPNADRTECYLPQRADVGKHFIYSGGVDGQRESFQSSIQRVTSFGRYYMGKEALDSKLPPLVKGLFNESSFQDAARRICPKESQLLDPFQFNVIMQIPGQTVASHIDAPYFWGADRKDFPQWLLAVMVFSNLFTDKFIHQVQVVGYLSDIAAKPGASQEEIDGVGGEFIYYQQNDEGRYTKEFAHYLAGSSVDGSKLVHASRIYKPSTQVPKMDKDKSSELVYLGSDKWELQVDGKTVAEYDDSELRVSIVYRARCFHDEEELKAYEQFPEKNRMSLEYVLKTLIKDASAKGVIRRDAYNSMPRVDLAMALMGHYIKYPYPSIDERPYMPYNYCLLSKKFPYLPDIC